MRQQTDLVVIHCSATPPSMDVGAKEIDRWHRERGWLEIGYHIVIRRSGEVEYGRKLDAIGAHVKGHNKNSIGVCLIGGVDENHQPENNFTYPQRNALKGVLSVIGERYGDVEVVGHNELSDKACPSFQVSEWL